MSRGAAATRTNLWIKYRWNESNSPDTVPSTVYLYLWKCTTQRAGGSYDSRNPHVCDAITVRWCDSIFAWPRVNRRSRNSHRNEIRTGRTTRECRVITFYGAFFSRFLGATLNNFFFLIKFFFYFFGVYPAGERIYDVWCLSGRRWGWSGAKFVLRNRSKHSPGEISGINLIALTWNT